MVLICHNDFHSLLSTLSSTGTELQWVRVMSQRDSCYGASITYCLVYLYNVSTKQLPLSPHTNTSAQLRVQYPATKVIICGLLNDLNGLQIDFHFTQVVNLLYISNTTDVIVRDVHKWYQGV